MKTSRIHQLIERLGLLARSESRRIGSEMALQPVHVQALQYLERCNRYSNTPAALVGYLGQTKGTVSQSLKLLAREGYLEKRTDPEDARVVRLHLTPKAHQALRQLPPTETWMHAERTLSPSERKALTAGLESLLKALQAAHGGRTFGICSTCRHFQNGVGEEHRCGLTGEVLTDDDSRRICQEHEERRSA